MLPPNPLYRGQGNARFTTADARTGAKRGQTVPYEVNGAPAGGTVSWGDIIGSLSAQADLVAALAAKLDDSQASAYGLTVLAAANAGALKTLLALVKADVGLGNVDNTADAAKNVLTATKLLTARAITLTGDAAWSVNFDGSAAVTAGLTLATVNSNVGSFGGATKSLTATVNAKGLITAISEQTVTPAVGSITGLGTGVATALAVNTGSAGAFLTFNGALGAPSSGNLVNCTFPTLNQNTTGSAATLTTSRNFSIGGGGITAAAVGFNGSAAVVLSASVDAGHITLARMADVTTATVFYRKTAGTGAPEVQTLATLKTDLGLTGTNSGDQTITLTGDVTGSGTGSFAATIGANKVTFAKFVAASAASIVGATAAGNFGELTPSSARTVMGLGTMATQAASAVAITGGTVAGLTSLAMERAYPGAGNTPASVSVDLGAVQSGGSRVAQAGMRVDFNRLLDTDYGSTLVLYRATDNSSIDTLKVTADGLEPATDNTFYLGRNSSSSPKAFKGAILKDTVSGTYYRLQITSGAVSLVSL